MCASRALHLRVVLRSASSASSGSLWERHRLRPTLTQMMRICIFNKIPRGVLCILKFERPCNWESAHPAHMWRSITKSHFPPLTSFFLKDQDLGQNEELTTSVLPPKGVVHTFYSPGLNLRSLLSLLPSSCLPHLPRFSFHLQTQPSVPLLVNVKASYSDSSRQEAGSMSQWDSEKRKQKNFSSKK